jgi:hypothetical protein
MHNERLSDQDDPIVRQIKELTDKRRNQTDSDKELISKLEWRGGVYVDTGGELVMPLSNIIRCFREAAAITKEGRKIARGLSPSEMTVPLRTDGSRKIEELITQEKYFDRRQVKVGNGRIKRTRPIFHKWGLVASFELLDDMLNFSSLTNIADLAGRAIGLCDARILGYGRFDAKISKA